MLNAKSFLAVDFGAANLKLAEFELNEAGGLLLKQYGFRSLGQEGAQEATREAAMLMALRELLSEKNYSSKNINVCAPGFHTFSKFVKLPPVDTSKVTQIIQYEAQQNVPFPLEEVVWDYQILGATATGELEVLLVAIKSDIVEGLFRVAESAGLRLQLVDVSPAALCNAFRYNYGDLEGCTMLLDIGAKTSNLLFFEKGNIYSRGINIGANAITQDFSKESRLTFAEAEKLKVEEGFVSLGGAYEEPDNPNQAAISKIARQVMTRLHIQVNQTVQFYRGQQGGSAPQRLFLSGGAAIMPYTAQFFSEKLNVPVEYFNPFRNVQIDPSQNLEELAKVAHALGEVVGLGLRNLAHCPVELNLMPKSSLKRQQLSQKKPYFIASVFGFILILFAIGWFYDKVASEKAATLESLKAKVEPLMRNKQIIQTAVGNLATSEHELEHFTSLVEDRFYWGNVLSRIRGVLQSVEAKKEDEFKTKTGVWVERFIPMTTNGPVFAGVTVDVGDLNRPDANDSKPRQPDKPSKKKPPAQSNAASVGEVANVLMKCRAVNVNSAAMPAANTTLAFAVASELAAMTEYFNPGGTALTGKLVVDESGLTFVFDVTLQLKRPLKY